MDDWLILVGESEEATPSDARRFLRRGSRADVRGLLSEDEIWYGTHFIVQTPSGEKRVAISITNVYLVRREPGDFLLYRDGILVEEHADRAAAESFLTEGMPRGMPL